MDKNNDKINQFSVHSTAGSSPPEINTNIEESAGEKSGVVPNRIRKLKSILKDILICSIQVIVLTLIIINFIGRVSVVQGRSMHPSLSSNNRIIVNLFVYRYNNPGRGDIVIFKCPRKLKKDYIKRIVGLPGEEVEIKKGYVYINGRKLDEPYVEHPVPEDNMEKVRISQDEIFVMGDNRGNSEDSRSWGPLKKHFIRGKAIMIFWPPESFSLFK